MAVSFVWLETLPPLPRSQVATTASRGFPVVVLDPGHGGQDSGAMCGNIAEKDLTLDVAQRVDRQLQSKGVGTVLTRATDNYLSLAQRAALTNSIRECVFVSIHFNEGPKGEPHGIETYYAQHQVTAPTPVVAWLPFLQRASLPAPNVQSQSLAGFIQDSLVTATQAVNRGTKAEQFYVIANVRHPAVLVEGGFLSNADEIAKLNDANYRERLAGAICDGIVRYCEMSQQHPPQVAAGGSVGTE
jgi:N-acetylmuramoyl-L-alanine amidase